MLRFDQEKMVKLVSELRKATTRLKALSSLKREVFLKDPDKIGSAKYNFIVAIESCIDMCSHVISRNGFRAPEDYSDTFRVMGEEGALTPDFANKLVHMAKFRNRLVHLYWEIDDMLIYELLNERLSDFKKFLDALSGFLGWNGPPD